jgi:hypothetical protein
VCSTLFGFLFLFFKIYYWFCEVVPVFQAAVVKGFFFFFYFFNFNFFKLCVFEAFQKFEPLQTGPFESFLLT